MPTGCCSNCGRVALKLLRCKGKCGGDASYCNKSCQKADWKMHKKICPVGGKSAQKLTFGMSHPPGHPFAELPNAAPVQAVRRMDAYGGSGMTLLYSDHLGIEPLMPMPICYFVAMMLKTLVERPNGWAREIIPMRLT